MESNTMCPLSLSLSFISSCPPGFFHLFRCWEIQLLIHLDCWVIVHCTNLAQFVYPFICWRTFRLFLSSPFLVAKETQVPKSYIWPDASYIEAPSVVLGRLFRCFPLREFIISSGWECLWVMQQRRTASSPSRDFIPRPNLLLKR